jgi:hypothetical protein
MDQDQDQFNEIDEKMSVYRVKLVTFMDNNEYAAEEEINEKSREILADLYSGFEDMEELTEKRAVSIFVHIPD